MKQLLFFLVIFTVFSAAHLFVGFRLFREETLGKVWKRRAWIAWIGLFALEMSGEFAYRAWTSGPYPWPLTLLSWLSYLGMGLFIFLFWLVLLRDFVHLVVKAYHGLRGRLRREPREDAAATQADLTRRAFLGKSATAGLLGAGVLANGFGVAEARCRLSLEPVEVALPRLPKSFEGFRIAQISDLHVGPTIRRSYVERVVGLVMDQQPDCIVFTGDMADGHPEQLAHDLAPLAELKAPHGVFWVNGNHEYYWSAKNWANAARGLGFTTLENEHVALSQDGEQLILAGVTDYSAERMHPEEKSDPHKALRGAAQDTARILLAHQPRSCVDADKAGVDLMLSGHTHGGQFIPWNFLVRLQQPYIQGLHQYGSCQVYVNRGTGYWGPPLRLGVPAEVTLLTLTRQQKLS